MKIKFTSILVILLISALFLTSCTSSSSVVSTWSGALITDSMVYFGDSSTLYALRAENGNTAWSYPEKASATRLFMAAPALTGEQLIVGDYANLLTSLSIRDGKENWQFDGATGRYIDSVLIVNDKIIAPNADDHIYALDLSGNKLWDFEAENSFWATPVSDGTNVYAGNLDHYFYAVDLESGSLTWKADLGASVTARAALVDDTLYVGNITGDFYAIDTADGSIKWTQSIGAGIWSAPMIIDGDLYFGDQDGKVSIVSAEDGILKKSIETGSGIIGTGVEINDGVMFGNENGELVMLSMDGEKLWTREVDGAIYSNLQLNGDTLLVVATKGEKPLIAMDSNANEIWCFATKK